MDRERILGTTFISCAYDMAGLSSTGTRMRCGRAAGLPPPLSLVLYSGKPAGTATRELIDELIRWFRQHGEYERLYRHGYEKDHGRAVRGEYLVVVLRRKMVARNVHEAQLCLGVPSYFVRCIDLKCRGRPPCDRSGVRSKFGGLQRDFCNSPQPAPCAPSRLSK